MPTSSAFVLRIMFSKSQNIRCIFHKESAVESSEKCFISCLCCARCAGMWCFASSRNHRDIRSRLCGGIVTSVWRRCCCLRDPLQSILNNSFRLHFSLKLQFCVSLFVSSPKEEPEKDEKGSKDESSSRVWPRSRRKFWQCCKIKSGHGFHIHL